jgi:phospholipid-binding lipoprotein MlaA
MLVWLLVTASPAHAEEKNPDPWMGLNQVTFKVNDAVDRVLIRPVARGYEKFVPSFLRKCVGNFFGNLDDIDNSVNNVLQGKVGAGIADLFRVGVNTTVGLGGVLDPASAMGFAKHNEDFGQTLSVWGVPRGPYLVLPMMGPSTLTDAVGRPVDNLLDPLRELHPVDHRNRLFALELVHRRASVLAAEKVVFGDRYIFIRDAYLQRREYLINDGKVEDSFDDEFF